MAAKGWRKEFCKRGHARTTDNVRGFVCRQCERERPLRRSLEQKARAKATAKSWRQRHIDRKRASDARYRARRRYRQPHKLGRPKGSKNRQLKQFCVRGHVRTAENLDAKRMCRQCLRLGGKRQGTFLWKMFGTSRVSDELKTLAKTYYQLRKLVRGKYGKKADNSGTTGNIVGANPQSGGGQHDASEL
jgi:hypothetical protein